MDSMLVVLVVVALVAGGGYAIHRRVETYRDWKAFASEHGLGFTGYGVLLDLGLEGTYRGREVRVWIDRRSSGEADDPSHEPDRWTVYEVELPFAVPRDLAVYEENLLSGVGEMFGAQDIEVGREILDEACTIKADDPDRARAYLGRPEVGDTFVECRNRFKGGFAVENGEVRFEHPGADYIAPTNPAGRGEVQTQSGMEAAFDGAGLRYERQNLVENLDALVAFAERLERLEEQGQPGGRERDVRQGGQPNNQKHGGRQGDRRQDAKRSRGSGGRQGQARHGGRGAASGGQRRSEGNGAGDEGQEDEEIDADLEHWTDGL